MVASSIENNSLGILVANQLRLKIFNRKIQFGDRLIETELSDHFEVSRNTIRDALKILEYEGLVVNKPRKGTYVTTFTKEDFNEIIDLRMIIESYAFERAIDHIKNEETKHLQSILHKMEKSAEKKDWSRLFDLDMEFHQYIVSLSYNSRIIEVYKSIQVQIRAILIHLDQVYSTFDNFLTEHKDLFNALLTKDPIIVKGQVVKHIKYVEGKLINNEQF